MTFTRDQQISPLQANTSFYDWYLKENEEIIDKLNGMRVFGATSGDGVQGLVDNDGLLRVSIGGTNGIISTGLTFNGDVSFNGFTPIRNVTYRISGITSGTVGFTFGTPVYYHETLGYTSGKADTQSTSETIGVMSKLTDSSAYVTLFGKIEGSFTNVTDTGFGLSAGCIYFLDPDNKGKITTTEPVISGQTSKPILLSIGATAGIVLQYRGNYLNSTAAAGGASGSNIIYVVIPTVAGLADQFTPGSVISCNSNLDSTDDATSEYFAVSSRSLFTSNSDNVWFLSKSSSSPSEINALEREEDFVVGIILSATVVGANTLFGVAISGSIPFVAPSGTKGLYALSKSFVFNDAQYPQLVINNSASNLGKLFGIQFDDSNFIVINNPRKSDSVAFSSNTSGTTVASAENILSNGDFSIWQRPSNGKDAGYTGQENLIFADLWRRRDGITGSTESKSFSIERNEFLDNDDDIEGDPKYLLYVKALGLSGGTGSAISGYTGAFEVGHIVPDARTLAAETATLSFYAKSTIADYIIQAYYARYDGNTKLDKTIINDAISLTTSWQRFDIPFEVAGVPWDSGTNMTDDYFEVGFDFNTLIQQANDNSLPLNTDLRVAIASVCLFLGENSGAFHTHRSSSQRLKECQKYYYSSYNADQTIGSATMTSGGGEASYNSFSHMIFPTTYSNVVQWPSIMRSIPTCTIYSPFSGISSEAYNATAGRDLRNCSGTIGYGSVSRVARKNTLTLSTDSTKDGVRIDIKGGIANYDKIIYHIVADADYPIA